MMSIEVDFEVFKVLTVRRRSEEMTENEVIRELLGMAGSEDMSNEKAEGVPWVVKGVRFPHGTEFKATYKNQQFSAKVQNGALVLRGKRYTSPSSAARAITGVSVNGWEFWECLLPNDNHWKKMSDLRK